MSHTTSTARITATNTRHPHWVRPPPLPGSLQQTHDTHTESDHLHCQDHCNKHMTPTLSQTTSTARIIATNTRHPHWARPPPLPGSLQQTHDTHTESDHLHCQDHCNKHKTPTLSQTTSTARITATNTWHPHWARPPPLPGSLQQTHDTHTESDHLHCQDHCNKHMTPTLSQTTSTARITATNTWHPHWVRPPPLPGSLQQTHDTHTEPDHLHCQDHCNKHMTPTLSQTTSTARITAKNTWHPHWVRPPPLPGSLQQTHDTHTESDHLHCQDHYNKHMTPHWARPPPLPGSLQQTHDTHTEPDHLHCQDHCNKHTTPTLSQTTSTARITATNTWHPHWVRPPPLPGSLQQTHAPTLSQTTSTARITATNTRHPHWARPPPLPGSLQQTHDTHTEPDHLHCQDHCNKHMTPTLSQTTSTARITATNTWHPHWVRPPPLPGSLQQTHDTHTESDHLHCQDHYNKHMTPHWARPPPLPGSLQQTHDTTLSQTTSTARITATNTWHPHWARPPSLPGSLQQTHDTHTESDHLHCQDHCNKHDTHTEPDHLHCQDHCNKHTTPTLSQTTSTARITATNTRHPHWVRPPPLPGSLQQTHDTHTEPDHLHCQDHCNKHTTPTLSQTTSTARIITTNTWHPHWVRPPPLPGSLQQTHDTTLSQTTSTARITATNTWHPHWVRPPPLPGSLQQTHDTHTESDHLHCQDHCNKHTTPTLSQTTSTARITATNTWHPHWARPPPLPGSLQKTHDTHTESDHLHCQDHCNKHMTSALSKTTSTARITATNTWHPHWVRPPPLPGSLQQTHDTHTESDHLHCQDHYNKHMTPHWARPPPLPGSLQQTHDTHTESDHLHCQDHYNKHTTPTLSQTTSTARITATNTWHPHWVRPPPLPGSLQQTHDTHTEPDHLHCQDHCNKHTTPTLSQTTSTARITATNTRHPHWARPPPLPGSLQQTHDTHTEPDHLHCQDHCNKHMTPTLSQTTSTARITATNTRHPHWVRPPPLPGSLQQTHDTTLSQTTSTARITATNTWHHIEPDHLHCQDHCNKHMTPTLSQTTFTARITATNTRHPHWVRPPPLPGSLQQTHDTHTEPDHLHCQDHCNKHDTCTEPDHLHCQDHCNKHTTPTLSQTTSTARITATNTRHPHWVRPPPLPGSLQQTHDTHTEPDHLHCQDHCNKHTTPTLSQTTSTARIITTNTWHPHWVRPPPLPGSLQQTHDTHTESDHLHCQDHYNKHMTPTLSQTTFTARIIATNTWHPHWAKPPPLPGSLQSCNTSHNYANMSYQLLHPDI